MPVQPGPRFPRDQNSNQSIPTSVEQNRIKFLNRMRQKSIVDDTTRLLMLARELNAEPSKMSSEQGWRKAAEIERLAKSVREKMSYAIGANPTASNTFSVVP